MTVESRSLRVGAAERRYLLAAPASGPCAGVLLSLHGSTSAPDRQLRLTGMADLADTAGGVVAFPEGGGFSTRGHVWDPQVDVPFLSDLVDHLLTEFQPASGRVGLTGMSGGARMSCELAWARGDAVAAVGAVAGLRTPAGAPRRRVPVMALHGTADRINPYQGGGRAYWGESVPAAAARWAIANGLPPEPTVAPERDGVTRATYGDADDPAGVTLYTIAGGGHTWPGRRLPLLLRLFLGKTSMAIDATDLIWRFYLHHASAA